jgi:ADP-ribose pyrophosphatase YjhB (NUDIX family)
MTRRVPKGDHRPRHACSQCDFVHYLDPKVACGSLPEIEDKIVLIKRNVEPRVGFWSFPCGFMEIDETVELAAKRETHEETGLQVELDGHLGTYSYPDSWFGGAVVVVVYRSRVVGGSLQAGDDADQARLFSPSEIPWNELAFRSSFAALQDWFHWKGIASPNLRE